MENCAADVMGPTRGRVTIPTHQETTLAYQPFNLQGKTALITGGNGGIGYGMASALLGLFKPAGQQGWGQLSHHSFQAGEVHRLKLGLGQSHGGRW